MNRRAITDEQLAELGRLASQQFESAIKAWELGMTCFLLNSLEYRAICTAGKSAERNYRRLWALAETQGWTPEQVREVFNVGQTCTWN